RRAPCRAAASTRSAPAGSPERADRQYLAPSFRPQSWIDDVGIVDRKSGEGHPAPAGQGVGRKIGFELGKSVDTDHRARYARLLDREGERRRERIKTRLLGAPTKPRERRRGTRQIRRNTARFPQQKSLQQH